MTNTSSFTNIFQVPRIESSQLVSCIRTQPCMAVTVWMLLLTCGVRPITIVHARRKHCLSFCGWRKQACKTNRVFVTWLAFGMFVAYISQANTQTILLASRIVYLEAKGIKWILENPTTSLLWRYPAIRAPCQTILVYHWFFQRRKIQHIILSADDLHTLAISWSCRE